MKENHQDIYAYLSPEAVKVAQELTTKATAFLQSPAAHDYFAFKVSSCLTDNWGDNVGAFAKWLESIKSDSERFLI